MNIFNYVSLIAVAIASPQPIWPPFPGQSPWPTYSGNQNLHLGNYFNEQKNFVRNLIKHEFEKVAVMRNSINTYKDEINGYVNNIGNVLPEKNTKADQSVPQMIFQNGYTCETHTVVSQGYLLNMHRIPRGKSSKSVSYNTVFLHHGILASSADWILNGPGKGLAYVLADAGYDVWMANVRGNRYSRQHARLDTNSKEFWSFSWHEVALYDVPKELDYIINLKGTLTKISYIGHSMGTTILFAMLALRPEYNRVLKVGIALAPEVFLSDVRSPVKSLAPIAIAGAKLKLTVGSNEFFPKDSSLGRMSNRCDDFEINLMMCRDFLFTIFGSNEKQFNMTLLPVFLSHAGTGTSWKTVVHFSQGIMAGGKFQYYDYGLGNLRVYGTLMPPEYDLSKVSLPITLFWSRNDLLSGERDVRALHDRLPLATSMYMVPDPNFSHLDYLLAIDANILVNGKVLEILNKP